MSETTITREAACEVCRDSYAIEVPINGGDDTICIPCPECCPFDSAEELRAFEGIIPEDAMEADRVRDLVLRVNAQEFDGMDYLAMFDEPAWLSRI